MLRRALFQLHLLLGITFGCILVVTSVTGIMQWFVIDWRLAGCAVPRALHVVIGT